MVLWFQSCVARRCLMTSPAVRAPAAQIGSMTSHSASEIRKPRAIAGPPLATTVATFDYSCGQLSRGRVSESGTAVGTFSDRTLDGAGGRYAKEFVSGGVPTRGRKGLKNSGRSASAARPQGKETRPANGT